MPQDTWAGDTRIVSQPTHRIATLYRDTYRDATSDMFVHVSCYKCRYTL